jgi:DNA polymerase III gamma/tau subunit
MYKVHSAKHDWDPMTRKYSPLSLDDLIGNVKSFRTLKALINDLGRPRGYIFHGPYGIGKSVSGWAFAKDLGADDFDINFASLRDYKDIKSVRRIIDGFPYMPHGKARVFIFDEAHNLVKAAQEEMLRWLDDPPRTLHLIFCTAELKRLIVPLQDRCFKVELQPLEFKERMMLLRRICKREQVELDRQVLKQIARGSDGIPRKLINGLLAEIALLRKTKDQVRTEKVKLRVAK